MPKVLFIAAHRPGRSPSQRFRYEQYIEFLESHGFECHFSWLISEKDDAKFYQPGNYLNKFIVFIKCMYKRLNDVFRASKYDIIFIQREAFMTGSVFFEKCFARSGARLIFDFDDSIWLHDVSQANQSLGWLKKPDKIATIIRLADKVIAGNAYLASYAGNFNQDVRVIPTTIDLSYHQKVKVVKPNNKICIGWTGTHSTIKHFETAIGALKKITNLYPERVCIKVISDISNYKVAEFAVQSVLWKRETEISDLCTFDIGIMPLPDDDWAKGKCGFKGLQYMALEIPAVMSPVGVNKDIIEDGVNGFLPSNETEWVRVLSQLIESETLRIQTGIAGRVTVRARYSVDAWKEKYLAIFQSVTKKTE